MKTKPITIRVTPEKEDSLLIHAHVRGIKRRATMAQIIFDKGLEVMEADLETMLRKTMEKTP